MTNGQVLDQDRYLARRGIRPHASHSAWLDRDTRQSIIRVVHEPDEQNPADLPGTAQRLPVPDHLQLGTPDAVIITAVEAALSPPPPQAGQRKTRQATGQRRTQEGQR
jgi:hypothetical protein